MKDNPCSLNRERDAAFAAKLLTLPTGFFSAEKSEEWMARSPVWPDDVIASETASRHQPMNWRDSIWAQTRSRGRGSWCVKLATQRLVPYSENKGYASNPRRFRLENSCNRIIASVNESFVAICEPIEQVHWKESVCSWIIHRFCVSEHVMYYKE